MVAPMPPLALLLAALPAASGWWGDEAALEPPRDPPAGELPLHPAVEAALFDPVAGPERVERLRLELGLPPPLRRERHAGGQGGGGETGDAGWSPWDDDEEEGDEEGRQFSKGATDRQSMETLARYQRLQAEAVGQRTWPDKPTKTLLAARDPSGASAAETCGLAPSVWPVACDDVSPAHPTSCAAGKPPHPDSAG